MDRFMNGDMIREKQLGDGALLYASRYLEKKMIKFIPKASVLTKNTRKMNDKKITGKDSELG